MQVLGSYEADMELYNSTSEKLSHEMKIMRSWSTVSIQANRKLLFLFFKLATKLFHKYIYAILLPHKHVCVLVWGTGSKWRLHFCGKISFWGCHSCCYMVHKPLFFSVFSVLQTSTDSILQVAFVKVAQISFKDDKMKAQVKLCTWPNVYVTALGVYECVAQPRKPSEGINSRPLLSAHRTLSNWIWSVTQCPEIKSDITAYAPPDNSVPQIAVSSFYSHQDYIYVNDWIIIVDCESCDLCIVAVSVGMTANVEAQKQPLE